MTEENNEPEQTFDILMRILRNMEALRITDIPMNDLALVYYQSHNETLENCLNEVRKEL